MGQLDNKVKIEERRKYLIHKKLPRWSVIFQILATFICWMILLYCYRSMFLDIYYYVSGQSDTLNFPQSIIENFLLYAVITFIVITIWIFYNKWMYGGRDRRKGFPMPSDEKQAEKYGLSMEQLLLMRRGRLIDVGFDDENRINHVVVQKYENY